MGEAEFGLKKGIISTRPGWLGSVEVVEVKFDPGVTSFEDLARHAAKKRCAQPIFACNDKQMKTAKVFTSQVKPRGQKSIRWVKDNKYYMSQGSLKYLPLTKTQATRINAGLTQASYWLSPSQRRMLKTIKAHPRAGWPSAIGKPFLESWAAARKIANKLKS